MEKYATILLILILSIVIVLTYFMEKDNTLQQFDTIGTYVIYVKPKDNYEELVFTDKYNQYYVKNNQYIFQNGKYTFDLKDALLREIITINQAVMMIPDLVIRPTNHFEIGQIKDYVIYQSKSISMDCKEEIDVFYMTNDIEYYFSCKVSSMYIVRDNLKDYSLTQALDSKRFTIDELTAIIPSIKYQPITYKTIGNINELEIVETIHKYPVEKQVEVIYETDDSVYYFPSKKSQFYKIKQGNTYYSLQDALALELIFIDDLTQYLEEINEK